MYAQHPLGLVGVCWDWALESMTWCNRLRFIYKFIYLCFLVSFKYFICSNWLFKHTHPTSLTLCMTWCIRNCIKDPSHGFLVEWWVVYWDWPSKSKTWCNKVRLNHRLAILLIYWHWFEHLVYISYIVHDLGELGVARKIQVMGSL